MVDFCPHDRLYTVMANYNVAEPFALQFFSIMTFDVNRKVPRNSRACNLIKSSQGSAVDTKSVTNVYFLSCVIFGSGILSRAGVYIDRLSYRKIFTRVT